MGNGERGKEREGEVGGGERQLEIIFVLGKVLSCQLYVNNYFKHAPCLMDRYTYTYIPIIKKYNY